MFQILIDSSTYRLIDYSMDLLAFELLVIAAVWGWWSYRNPEEAFVSLPMLLPTYVARTNIGPIPTTGLELFVVALVIAWIAKRGKAGIHEAWERIGGWRLAAGGWLVAGLIAVIVAPDHLGALGLYRAYFIEPLVLFFIGHDLLNPQPAARNPQPIHKLASNFAFITVVLGIWAIVQYLTGWGIPDPWNALDMRRAVGPFPFPNALALFVTPVVALAFADRVAGFGVWGLGFEKTKRQTPNAKSLISPWLGWSAIVFGIIAIILAKSDGGLIAFGASAFITLLLHKRTRKIGIALAMIGFIATMAVPQLKERATELIYFKEWSGKVRLVMWGETFEMLKDRPIFGAGLGAYPIGIEPYHHADWMEIFQYPHNILLNFWSEVGLFGVVVFGWIVWKWAAGSWQLAAGKNKSSQQPAANSQQPWNIPAIAIITAILVHGLVDVPYFKNDLAIAFWIFIFLTANISVSDSHPGTNGGSS